MADVLEKLGGQVANDSVEEVRSGITSGEIEGSFSKVHKLGFGADLLAGAEQTGDVLVGTRIADQRSGSGSVRSSGSNKGNAR